MGAWGRGLWLARSLLQYACLGHCTLEFVGDFVVCSGPSMEPGINASDVLLSERISIRMHDVPRGSIVIVRSPSEPHIYLCKRLIALPGDRVPVPGSSHYVPKGHVWLEGDNKHNSTDSRSFGPIPFGLIRGRAIAKVWPLMEMGRLENPKTKVRS